MLTCHLLDEGSDHLVNEVAFKFIPTGNQATGTSLLQLEEGAQGAEDMIANGPLPAHEELLGMAGLLEGPNLQWRDRSKPEASRALKKRGSAG